MPPFAIDLSHPDFRADARQAGKRHPSLLVEDLPKLIEQLLQHPELGDQIPGPQKEVRKARVGVKQQNLGSRGAYRLIDLVERKRRILQPLALYYKPDLPDLPLRAIVSRLAKC